MKHTTAHIEMVFDGQCGFCTRAAEWLRRRDRRSRIGFHPFQRSGVLERFDLTEAEACGAVWAFEARGGDTEPVRLRGAAAANRALDVALGVRLFHPLYRLPLVRQVQDRVYTWVAEHRHRLRGVTPWCVTHPDDCGEPLSGCG